MKVTRIPAGRMATNCYILTDEVSGESAIIDPGGEAEKLISAVEKTGVKVKYILLTHGHFDHTGAVTALKKRYEVPVYINKKDYDMITSEVNEIYFIQDDDGKIDNFIVEDTVFLLGETKLTSIMTPGHTPGGVCFYVENILISGDTLFNGSVGRTDFVGGDHKTLINSINTMLMALPNDTVVFPGHGRETTIGDERNYNPFL